MSWFDGISPCPACGHTCYDHCVCADPKTDAELIDPPCPCSHEAHFSGELTADESKPSPFNQHPQQDWESWCEEGA